MWAKEARGRGLSRQPGGGGGLPKCQRQDADAAPAITHRGHSFSFIHLGIYKSLTWYNDLIKRKQNTQRTRFPPWPPLRKAQIYEVWVWGTSALDQSAAQKARSLWKQEMGPLAHIHY